MEFDLETEAGLKACSHELLARRILDGPPEGGPYDCALQ
jgi:hypothetical protein